MENSWKKLLIFVPLLVTVALIYFAIQFNQGSLVIEGEAPFVVSLSDGSRVTVQQAPYRQEIWPADYQINISKQGYQPYSESFTLKRGKEVVIRPSFIYLPVLAEVFPASSPASLYVTDTDLASTIPSNWQELAVQGEASWPLVRQVIGNNAERILLAPGLTQALVFHNDGRRIWQQFTLAQSTVLDPLLEKFAWSPDGQQLLAFGKNRQGDTFLNLFSSPEQKEKLTTLKGMTGLSLYWSPTGDKFAFIPSGALQERNVYVFDLKTKRKDKLTNQGNIVALKWHPQGRSLLYETVALGSFQPELHLFDLVINQDEKLAVSASLNKLAWLNNSTLLLALPAKQLNGVAGEASSLANVLDKLVEVRDNIAAGIIGANGQALSELLYSYELTAAETKLVFDPGLTKLLVEDIYLTKADKLVRLRSEGKIYQLSLVP